MESGQAQAEDGMDRRPTEAAEPPRKPRTLWRRLQRTLMGSDPDEVVALRLESRRIKGDVEHMRVRMKALETQLEDALSALTQGSSEAVDEVRLDTRGIVTCRGFVVLDKQNRVRIQAGIDDNGDATICWIDPMGKRRVVAGTALNGDASVLWLDAEGKRRMGAAAAANGNAGMYFADRNDVMRVGIATKNSGTGGVHVYDKDGKLRISAATFKDEQLSLPNEDLGAI